MNHIFKIKDVTLNIDVDKTKAYYLTQINITDDCTCDDCNYYATTFIKEDIEIFNLLLFMGVNLSKNVASAPTGVLCFADANGANFHVTQMYTIKGNFLKSETESVVYEYRANGINAYANFYATDNCTIDIDLIINRK